MNNGKIYLGAEAIGNLIEEVVQVPEAHLILIAPKPRQPVVERSKKMCAGRTNETA